MKTPLQYPGAAAVAAALPAPMTLSPQGEIRASATSPRKKKAASRARGSSRRKRSDGSEPAPLRVRIGVGPVSLSCFLNHSETAKQLAASLPQDGKARLRAEEVCFEVSPVLPPEDPKETVTPGIVGYAPQDHTLCLFHGVRPMYPINVVGVLMGDPQVLHQVLEGDFARIYIPLHEDEEPE